ncbi:MAG: PAS domain-containing sensor histidine kinase [Zetaproteobacteria bacterium]|nr:MAG: PAS domain-containing sensor histidine kinase [Zetaproteobacteria bacterium]
MSGESGRLREGMRFRRHLLLLSLFVLLLVGVVVVVDRFDGDEEARTSALIDATARVDAGIAREMMVQLFSGVRDEAALRRRVRRLRAMVARLERGLREDLEEASEGIFADEEIASAIRRSLAGLDTALAGQERRVRRFLAIPLEEEKRARAVVIEEAADDRIPAALSRLRRAYERHYADEARVHEISKRVLIAMVVALLIYLVVLLVAAARRNRFLQGVLDERSALQEGKRLLLAAMGSAPDGILVCDRDGRVRYANDALAAMHGVADPEELVGRSAAELRGGTPGDPLYREMRATVAQGREWQGDYRLVSADGEERVIARTMSCVSLDGHDYLVGIDRDVTEERARAERLAATQRLESLGVLAGGIAHDFNNILAAIQGNLALALRHADEDGAGYIRRAVQGAERAADLCRQMLAYAGKGRFVVEPVDLSALVGGLSELLAVSIDKRIDFVQSLADDLPAIEGDRAQLQQVVLNLITNASEAITGGAQPREEGRITIATRVEEVDAERLSQAVTGSDLPPGRYVVLEVADNGCGMDEETRKRIFEPFFTTKFTGRGLGMSAIRGIVQGHHGALLLESAPGEGSTFTILFPPSEREAVPEEPVGDEVQPEEAAGGTVLIIDDEEVVREVAAELLGECGITTICAADGVEGVASFRAHGDRIDAVLLDMTMPNMDGSECFRQLRAIRDDVPVVVTSGYSEEEVLRSFEEGALADFVHKPFDPERLQQVMRRVAAARRRVGEG